jgi:hypothetical protein
MPRMSRTDDRFATRRRVLRPETTVEHVDEFAKSVQWPMVGVTERVREAGTDGEVVWQADGHTLGKQVLKVGSLHYVQDAMFGIGYFFLTGRPQAVLETLAANAAQALDPWTVEELCQAFDQSDDPRTRGQAALRLGLAAPAQPDQQVVKRLGAALADQDARVRYASVFAASYTRYEALLPSLRAIAERDEEKFLRERAATALRSMDGVKV